jgi:hypothetical protein
MMVAQYVLWANQTSLEGVRQTSELVFRILIGLTYAGVVWMVTSYRRRAQAGQRFSLD